MKKLNFKTKILILVIAPLIIVSVLLTLLTLYQATKLGKKNVESFSNTIFDLRREELKNYTELALSAVEHIREDESLDEVKAQEIAKDIYRDLAFGEDGYFFVYDYNGVNLAHPKKPQLEGKNLWDLKDTDGVFLIQSLIRNARNDGGYTDYLWDKPSKGRQVGKIGYSLGYDDWEWMIGTGLYIDDLEEAVEGVETEVEENIRSTLTLIALAAAGFTLLVGLIGARFTMSEGKLADARLQQLSRKAVEGQEEERSRVARDLQRGINQALVAAKVKLHSVVEAGSLDEASARKDFAMAVGILNRTIKEVNRISGELRPEILDKMGLYAAVEDLVNKISKESNIKIDFKRMGDVSRLSEEIETAIYRIIQEAVNNIVTHSQSSTASVRLRRSQHSLSLNIQDNGLGFDIKDSSKFGVGFADMRVRAESLGGQFSVFSSKDIGTVIKVEIPIPI